MDTGWNGQSGVRAQRLVLMDCGTDLGFVLNLCTVDSNAAEKALNIYLAITDHVRVCFVFLLLLYYCTHIFYSFAKCKTTDFRPTFRCRCRELLLFPFKELFNCLLNSDIFT